MNFLFDLDGTLTDSRPGIVACIQHALNRAGMPPSDEEVASSMDVFAINANSSRMRCEVPLSIQQRGS
ncbi:MAG: HAD hydrolase-like protein [Steroidobacteraceae bacterium]